MMRFLATCALALTVVGCGDDDAPVEDMGPGTLDMGGGDDDMGGGDDDMGGGDEDMGGGDEDMGAATMGDFSFNLTMFTPHNGQTVYYSLRDDSGAEVSSGNDTVMGANLSFTDVGVTTAGASYDLYFFADIDDSESCDAPPTDHVWSQMDLTADAAGDLAAAYSHGTDFDPSACDQLP